MLDILEADDERAEHKARSALVGLIDTVAGSMLVDERRREQLCDSLVPQVTEFILDVWEANSIEVGVEAHASKSAPEFKPMTAKRKPKQEAKRRKL